MKYSYYKYFHFPYEVVQLTTSKCEYNKVVLNVFSCDNIKKMVTTFKKDYYDIVANILSHVLYRQLCIISFAKNHSIKALIL